VVVKESEYNDVSMACDRYDKCGAPVCPLVCDDTFWYPNEEVCGWKGAPDFVERQRKIRRGTALKGRVFTRAMLNHERFTAEGAEGIEPDQTPEEIRRAEQRWLEERQGISKEEGEGGREEA
jgi:hypothetical protein